MKTTARRKPEPPKFKPGDVVRLRSGGPPMTVTGYGFQSGRGAKRNRAFAARVKAERLQGVDRIVHVAFVSTKASRTEEPRWFIDREEIHEDAMEKCEPEHESEERDGCPPICGYGARQDELDEPKPRERVFASTCAPMNGDPDNDAYRDMDGFSADEELARLRLAIREPQFVDNDATPLARFVAEAFHNIDRSLVREGSLPRAWVAASRSPRYQEAAK